jgi:dTDP-4-dehydrorhamnose reductase
MVIGNGLIANEFKKIDHSKMIVFASGVSNSKQSDELECSREEDLINFHLNQMVDCLFIYFSTYSIDDKSSNSSFYVKHKLRMEGIVSQRIGPYLIVRTSNLVGYNSWNKVTIFNFLYSAVVQKKRVEVWTGATRNILDIQHLVSMVNYVIGKKIINTVVYLINPVDVSVSFILDRIDKYLNVETPRIIIAKGSDWTKDNKLSVKCFNDLNLNSVDYIGDLLIKYYPIF